MDWGGLGYKQATIRGLTALVHAGSLQTQRLFVMAMRNAVTVPAGAGKDNEAAADNARENRKTLFVDAPAKHLLKQLLRCAVWGDLETRTLADEALQALSNDVEELISNAKGCQVIISSFFPTLVQPVLNIIGATDTLNRNNLIWRFASG